MPLLLGERCEPGLDELLPLDSRLYFAMKPVLEVFTLIEIPEPAEPELPGLDVARRNADRHALQAISGKTRLLNSRLDVFVPLMKAGGVGIDDHQQPDGFGGTLPEISTRIGKAGEDERESAIWPSRLYADTVEQALEDRTKQPLLLDILAEQRTP
ncbi:MAG TPA: hypothetical protein VLQ45_25620 [Thermoanaerobaculia bacterium]|nr:hypothetical protein [Thermoanaerobaculia bacterium]